ncbi:glycosyltransferase [Agrilutibacter solisilvae]|uniref:Glycosyltransferase n=1 Tax=Agrilutibacter solisilvae TaxID=2763317 RepID=A0A974Y1U4_9GAMM|nr:glycosyltransferase [Lysobacter solisilvae]QSX78855.1 glycosyltransferase [Lysobacter solisilvae]
MISFILPAHDEAVLIGATLRAVHVAARALDCEYEIVVVDDASTDRTAEIAHELGARVLRVEHRHIAATRNAGARFALGDRLVFVDSDTLIDTAVLAAALGALAGGAVGGGATVRMTGTLAWYERLAVGVAVPVLRWARIAPGCFIFCTRAAFEAAGGFDERLYAAEDVALSHALARRGRFVLLRETVATSERKLRTFGAGEHLRLLWRLARHGRGALRSRDHLRLWYDKRRHGPP